MDSSIIQKFSCANLMVPVWAALHPSEEFSRQSPSHHDWSTLTSSSNITRPSALTGVSGSGPGRGMGHSMPHCCQSCPISGPIHQTHTCRHPPCPVSPLHTLPPSPALCYTENILTVVGIALYDGTGRLWLFLWHFLKACCWNTLYGSVHSTSAE